MVNFHLAKAADEWVFIKPSNDGKIAEAMFTDVLGLYPQAPFLLHTLEGHDEAEAFESIRILMSGVDRTQYPSWLPCELEGLFFMASSEEPPNPGLAADA